MVTMTASAFGPDSEPAADPESSLSTLRQVPVAEPPAPAFDEADLASYLVEHPEFFLRHGEVLLGVSIPDPLGGRAISLHERQLAQLRDRHRALERRLADLVRAGEENDAIADRLARFTRDLLLVREPAVMPAQIQATLAESFRVPDVVVKVWDVAPAFAGENFALTPTPAVRAMADDLRQPYCGLRMDQAPLQWFADAGQSTRSVAMLALRRGASVQAFGMILFGSPDPDRFQTGMGTAFLERIGEVASAALGRLLPDADARG